MHFGQALPAAFALRVSSVLPAWADTLAGRAEVVDGDTIAITGIETRGRLFGVDAPEGKGTCLDVIGDCYLCGSRAADALASLIELNGRATCMEEDRDWYGRVVAACDAKGMDLNAEMVAQGWALEYPDRSDGRHSDEEAKVRQSAQGLWAGEFDEPWVWRRGQRSSCRPVIQLVQRGSCKAASSCEEAVVMSCGGCDGADGDDAFPCENVFGSVSQTDVIRGAIGCWLGIQNRDHRHGCGHASSGGEA